MPCTRDDHEDPGAQRPGRPATGSGSGPPGTAVLPPLPLEPWEPTRDTVHLWAQVVGKARLALTPMRNHWWNVTLYVGARGLTTRRIPVGEGGSLEVELDLVDHRLVARTEAAAAGFSLADGLSVAEFHRRFHATLAGLGVPVQMRSQPFGIPVTVPFAEDTEHAAYDAEAVGRCLRVLQWVDGVFDEFAGWSTAKTSPVHLFWHSFDLAVTRFSGRRAPAVPGADPVTREAYSHEVVSFGFWAGDVHVREPAFYSYTAPEPPGLRERPLRPAPARWIEQRGGSLAYLPYDAVRGAGRPREALLAFLQSAYEAGAGLAGWDVAGLATDWCPVPSGGLGPPAR